MTTLINFLTYLKRSKYSQDTIDTYESLLGQFESWLQDKGKTLATFTTLDVDEYRKQTYSTSSANTLLASVKAYLRYRVGTLPLGDPNIMRETQRENQIRLLRSGRTPTKIRKTALNADEVAALLKELQKGVDPRIYHGAVVAFYLGARTSELTLGLQAAKINWKKREAIVPTLKRGGSERFVAWHEKMTPHMKEWYEAIDDLPYPREWIAKKLHKYRISGLRITPRVARKTFQTNMRNLGIEDFYLDHLLGHVSRSAIADVYTDYSDETFKRKIREIMCDKHYMIVSGVI